VRRAETWRQRMARWLDPTVADMPAPRVIEAAPSPEVSRVQDPWPAICEQFSLRILAAAYQMGTHLEAAEAEEQDPDRLEKLYRIDHATTRIRRQAENLQVLVGRRVEDADPQVTPLLDVIRAATSAIDQYSRVHIGQMVDLAVADFAADDVIRVLTELVDNAARFSPPTAPVIVSAYITEQGSVLLRVEDSGLGVPPAQLPVINAMLAGDALPPLDGDPAAHLGLVVVRRLALAHHLRVHLTARPVGGTTAVVLIPEGLLCEIAPVARSGSGSPPVPSVPRQPRPANRAPSVTYRAGAQAPASRLTLVNSSPAADAGRTVGRQPGGGAGRESVSGDRGLPRRVPASLRGESAPAKAAGRPPTAVRESDARPQPGAPHEPAAAQFPPPDGGAYRQTWPDETADFVAGISDANWPRNDESSEGFPQ
jgi:hypothetical protein